MKNMFKGGIAASIAGAIVTIGVLAGPAQAAEVGKRFGTVEKQVTHSRIVHADGKGSGSVPKPTNCQWWFPWYCA